MSLDGPVQYVEIVAINSRLAFLQIAHVLRSLHVPEPSPSSSGSAPSSDLARRYKEFMDLLPLTLALAGLPTSDSGRYYTEDQIETRVFAIKHAYKAAKGLIREIVSK